MREIKFRGKRNDNGKLVYGDLNTKSPFGTSIRSRESGKDFTVDPDTVGQFTGLKDKDGEEIYEGDILKYGDVNTVVKFLNGAFDLQSPSGIEGGWFQWVDPTRAITDWQGIEVIGNIYDNTELLNQ